MLSQEQLIKKGAKCELARRSFWRYCKAKAPDFYKEDREYLKSQCEELQDFLNSDDQLMVINEPPRHGKSRTVGCFVEWVLGNDHSQKIMTGSYNETLSTTFSKGVRNAISEAKADESKIVYSDIFPNTRIKYGDGAMNLWSLEDGYNNYLATSPGGTATGFGATIMIIDDLIKLAEEANNADVLDKQWSWFTDTMLSRLEEGGKIIIVMTRWHSEDLAGRALKYFAELGWKIRHINYRARSLDGKMLCEEILSEKSYYDKKAIMGDEIFSANYDQEPIDIKGRLYTSFKTYEELPKNSEGHVLGTIKNYTDTADTGEDYLCGINYVEYNREAYVINVLYTKAGMEITEPELAKMLFEDKVNVADIESNNGGRGFARNVERELREKYHSNLAVINSFYQSKNKQSRILSNSTWVMKHIYFPVNWKDKWPEYYDSMIKYQKEGKNAHDDAEDATTGVAEKVNQGDIYSW